MLSLSLSLSLSPSRNTRRVLLLCLWAVVVICRCRETCLPILNNARETLASRYCVSHKHKAGVNPQGHHNCQLSLHGSYRASVAAPTPRGSCVLLQFRRRLGWRGRKGCLGWRLCRRLCGRLRMGFCCRTNQHTSTDRRIQGARPPCLSQCASGALVVYRGPASERQLFPRNGQTSVGVSGGFGGRFDGKLGW